MPPDPVVSVCVLTMEDVTLATRLLDSVPTATTVPVETILVANGTSSSSIGRLGDTDDLVLVRSGVNLGFGGGNNLAVDSSRSEFLVFVNDDAVLSPGCIDRLVDAARRDPTIGAVGSCILSGDGTIQEAGAVLWQDGSATHAGRGRAVGSAPFAVGRDVDYASANGLLVRRTAWDRVGGFDPSYFPAYYEDADLCMALRGAGYRVVYEPTAELTHLESRSTSRPFRRFLMDRHRAVFATRWAEQLSDRPPHPYGDQTAAVSRAMAHPLLPDPRAGDAGTISPMGPEGGAGPARRAEPGAAGPQDDRELSAALRALEVKDAYIADLEHRLASLQDELWSRNRYRRALRTARVQLTRLGSTDGAGTDPTA